MEKVVDIYKGAELSLDDIEEYIVQIFYQRKKPQKNRFNWDGQTVEIFEGLMGKEGDQYMGFSARVGTIMTGKGGLRAWVNMGVVDKGSTVIYNGRKFNERGLEKFLKWLMDEENNA